MSTRLLTLTFAIMTAFAYARGALAQFPPHPIPESERWATITHVGNEPYFIPGLPGFYPDRYVGAVDHEYQISRTEVTGAEWLEFVNAAWPYVDPTYWSRFEFKSGQVERLNPGGSPPIYYLHPSFANRQVSVGWRYAARYANWLHNGKALTREAFENGAYDVSTFGFVEGYGYTDQVAHNPDARYWIPTLDEWVKSMHWDPDKNGPGQPGYWNYPTTSDVAPIYGPPSLGGQSSGGSEGVFQRLNLPLPDVAGYRDVMSPWGLWDGSGGFREWTETAVYDTTIGHPASDLYRATDGSSVLPDNIGVARLYDHVGTSGSSRPTAALIGFRLARQIPTPAGITAFVLTTLLFKRKRKDDS